MVGLVIDDGIATTILAVVASMFTATFAWVLKQLVELAGQMREIKAEHKEHRVETDRRLTALEARPPLRPVA